MKRLGKVWDKIVDLENIRKAHKRASEDKSYYKDVKMVNENPEWYLREVQRLLKTHKYKVSEYIVQDINDKGKQRKLMKLKYFPDRIIQWAVMLQIEPMLVNTMCRHVCASIPHRGSKKVNRLMKQYLKDEEGTKYTYKIDVRQFYPSIHHETLKKLLRKKIKDTELLWLLDLIIDSYPGDRGLPIGSYLSQYLANFYLSDFDHWLKEEKRIKYVVRYMDDIVIMAETKAQLHDLHGEAEEFLEKNLKLEIKDNWQIFPTDVRGVDFVGYRHFRKFRLLRKSTVKRMRKLCDSIFDKQITGKRINYREWCAVNSYVGWLLWCDSWRLYERYIEPIRFSVLKYYMEVIVKKYHSDKTEKAQVVRFDRYAKKYISKKGRMDSNKKRRCAA